jgi:hypothetical protein
MLRDVERDLTKSARVFADVVWPAVAPLCGGGDLQTVESVTEKRFTDVLDAHAGIDAWQVIKQKSVIRGIASRVQYSNRPYNTFTIRYRRDSGARTEYSKRREALLNREKGYLYPHLTIQAYVSNDAKTLLDAAIICTSDLFDQADRVVFRYESRDQCRDCIDATSQECLSGMPFYPSCGSSCSAYQQLEDKRIGGIRRTSNAQFIWLSWHWLSIVKMRISIWSNSHREAA